MALSEHPGFSERVFVLAGSYSEYVYYKANRAVPHNSIHITHWSKLMGIERGTADLVKVGTWDERPYRDIVEILDICRSRQMREVPPLREVTAWH